MTDIHSQHIVFLYQPILFSRDSIKVLLKTSTDRETAGA
jgi:hypothetical protein